MLITLSCKLYHFLLYLALNIWSPICTFALSLIMCWGVLISLIWIFKTSSHPQSWETSAVMLQLVWNLPVTLAMISAVSRKSWHLPMLERAKKSSIRRTPMLYPLWVKGSQTERQGISMLISMVGEAEIIQNSILQDILLHILEALNLLPIVS